MMSTRYLTTFIATIVILVALTLAYTMSVDPLGIYRKNSDEALSRTNQFWYMRTSKPLRLVGADADVVVLGTSRSGRLSTEAVGLDQGFNGAIPGSTPQEQFAMLSMAASLKTTQTVILGLDFDAFLSLYPPERLGFPSRLVQPVNQLDHYIGKLDTLKHTFFSPFALRLSLNTDGAKHQDKGAIYRNDGSWHRPQREHTTAGFKKLSHQKIESYQDAGSLVLQMDGFRRMLHSCHTSDLNCIAVITPIHLFHLGILDATDTLPLWREWHRELVAINQEIATGHSAQPIPLWAFNGFGPAVGEPISNRQEQVDPWFLDNVHFRPRFAQLIMQRVLDLPGAEAPDAGTLVDETTLPAYLQSVDALRASFDQREAAAIAALYEALGLL